MITWVKYALLAISSLLITVFAMIIAPLLPAFARNVEGPLDNATKIGL